MNLCGPDLMVVRRKVPQRFLTRSTGDKIAGAVVTDLLGILDTLGFFSTI